MPKTTRGSAAFKSPTTRCLLYLTGAYSVTRWRFHSRLGNELHVVAGRHLCRRRHGGRSDKLFGEFAISGPASDVVARPGRPADLKGDRTDSDAPHAQGDPRLVRLVALARSGDERAREALVRRALALSLRTAGATVGRRDAAADIAQDVGVDVLRGLGRLRDPASFDAWVHRITARRAIRAARASRLRLRREPPLESLGDDHRLLSVEDQPSPSFDPALRRALLALPPRQRLAVVLRYVHDLTEEGVADALGCAPGTAASLLSRARAELRRTPELAHLFADVNETSRAT